MRWIVPVAIFITLLNVRMAADAASASIQETDWERAVNCPCDAVSEVEKIAAEVMGKDRLPTVHANLQAKYIGEDRYYSLVEVTRIPDTQLEPKETVTFRMIGKKIIASYAQYHQEKETIPLLRQNYASNAAIKFYERELPAMPLIYEGEYAYRPKQGDNKCEVIVDELSTERELLHTYSVDVCNKSTLVIVEQK